MIMCDPDCSYTHEAVEIKIFQEINTTAAISLKDFSSVFCSDSQAYALVL